MDELLLITFSLQSCPTSQTPKPGVSHTRLTERAGRVCSVTIAADGGLICRNGMPQEEHIRLPGSFTTLQARQVSLRVDSVSMDGWYDARRLSAV